MALPLLSKVTHLGSCSVYIVYTPRFYPLLSPCVRLVGRANATALVPHQVTAPQYGMKLMPKWVFALFLPLGGSPLP